LSLDAVFGFELAGEGVELGLRARDEEDVVAFGCELLAEFGADAVGGAGYDGPAAFAAELGELVHG